LVDTKGNIGKLGMLDQGIDEEVSRLTNSDDSTGLPLALTMPHPPRKMAVVMATPIRIASTLLISGKVVMRQRK